MAAPRKITVLIRAFNEEAHIGRLLTGLERQRRTPDEVLLVDSGSTDATKSIAAAFGAEIVEIDKEDFSFGRSLNVGLQAAEGDVVALASAHVYPVFDDWLERLVEPFDDERIALAMGQHVDAGFAPSVRRRRMQRLTNLRRRFGRAAQEGGARVVRNAEQRWLCRRHPGIV